MNWLNCELPKNSRMAAMTGLALTKSCGMAVDISWYTLIFSLMARSMRTRPMRNWVSRSSPPARTTAAVAEMVDVVHHADVLAQLEEILDGRNEVGSVQGAIVERGVEPHLDVEL